MNRLAFIQRVKNMREMLQEQLAMVATLHKKLDEASLKLLEAESYAERVTHAERVAAEHVEKLKAAEPVFHELRELRSMVKDRIGPSAQHLLEALAAYDKVKVP